MLTSLLVETESNIFCYQFTTLSCRRSKALSTDSDKEKTDDSDGMTHLFWISVYLTN